MTELTAYNQTEAQQQADSSNASFLPLEFIRPAQASQIFSVSRSFIYGLISEGLVKSVALKKKGSPKGVRLISYQSISDYFNQLAEEQTAQLKQGGQA